MMEEQAGFNMGIDTLYRINYQLWLANVNQTNDDILGWYRALKVIYKEVSTYIKQEQRLKTHKEFRLKIEKAIEESVEYQKNDEIYREVFDLMELWEVELRQDLDKAGLLMLKGEGSYGSVV